MDSLVAEDLAWLTDVIKGVPRDGWGPDYYGPVLLSKERVRRFSESNGDDNPIHFDDEAAKRCGLPGAVVHGDLLLSLLSGDLLRPLIDTLRESRILLAYRKTGETVFHRPVQVGEYVKARVKIMKIEPTSRGAVLAYACEIRTLEGKLVLSTSKQLLCFPPS